MAIKLQESEPINYEIPKPNQILYLVTDVGEITPCQVINIYIEEDTLWLKKITRRYQMIFDTSPYILGEFLFNTRKEAKESKYYKGSD